MSEKLCQVRDNRPPSQSFAFSKSSSCDGVIVPKGTDKDSTPCGAWGGHEGSGESFFWSKQGGVGNFQLS
jgi:hypothetical protein